MVTAHHTKQFLAALGISFCRCHIHVNRPFCLSFEKSRQQSRFVLAETKVRHVASWMMLLRIEQEAFELSGLEFGLHKMERNSVPFGVSFGRCQRVASDASLSFKQLFPLFSGRFARTGPFRVFPEFAESYQESDQIFDRRVIGRLEQGGHGGLGTQMKGVP